MNEEFKQFLIESITDGVNLAEENIFINLKAFAENMLNKELWKQFTVEQLLQLFIEWLNLSLKSIKSRKEQQNEINTNEH